MGAPQPAHGPMRQGRQLRSWLARCRSPGARTRRCYLAGDAVQVCGDICPGVRCGGCGGGAVSSGVVEGVGALAVSAAGVELFAGEGEFSGVGLVRAVRFGFGRADDLAPAGAVLLWTPHPGGEPGVAWVGDPHRNPAPRERSPTGRTPPAPPTIALAPSTRTHSGSDTTSPTPTGRQAAPTKRSPSRSNSSSTVNAFSAPGTPSPTLFAALSPSSVVRRTPGGEGPRPA